MAKSKLLSKGSACGPWLRASRRWACPIKNDWFGNSRSTTHSMNTRVKRYECGLDDFYQAIEPGETALRRLECAYSYFYLRPLPWVMPKQLSPCDWKRPSNCQMCRDELITWLLT